MDLCFYDILILKRYFQETRLHQHGHITCCPKIQQLTSSNFSRSQRSMNFVLYIRLFRRTTFRYLSPFQSERTLLLTFCFSFEMTLYEPHALRYFSKFGLRTCMIMVARTQFIFLQCLSEMLFGRVVLRVAHTKMSFDGLCWPYV